MTYKHDSDIVTPYGKWVYTDTTIRSLLRTRLLLLPRQLPVARNMLAGKTRDALMRVSHCGTPNQRVKYAQQLAAHIGVDIVGRCGDMTDGDTPPEHEYRCRGGLFMDIN
jgi:glycoprotein 3-alpha-L-fucosyltransferase